MPKKRKPKIVFACSSKDIVADCPLCSAHAVVELSPELKAIQPDATTHVCHPGFGGCDHGSEATA